MRGNAKKMINDFAPIDSQKLLTRLGMFLKYYYVSHRMNNATATSHDIINGLGH